MTNPCPLFEVVPLVASGWEGLWPIHPQPLPDETVLSWLARLALAYGRTMKQFDDEVLGSVITKRGDTSTWRPRVVFDAARLEQALPMLARGVGLDISVLRALFFPPREEHDLFPAPGRAQLVCPQCWKSDKQPYIRRKWSLSTAAVCTEHGVQLFIRCPNCRADIRSDIFRWDCDHLAYCRNCGEDLREAEVERADRGVVAFCREVERVCDRWSTVGPPSEKQFDRTFVALVNLVQDWVIDPCELFESCYTSLHRLAKWLRSASPVLRRFDSAFLKHWLRHVRYCMANSGAECDFLHSDPDALRADLEQFSDKNGCVPAKGRAPHRMADVLAVVFHLWRLPEQRPALGRMFWLEPNPPEIVPDDPMSRVSWLGWPQPFTRRLVWRDKVIFRNLPVPGIAIEPRPSVSRDNEIIRDVPLPPLVIKPPPAAYDEKDNWAAKYKDPATLPIAEKMIGEKWAHFKAGGPALQQHVLRMMARRMVDRAADSAAADIFHPRF